MCPEMCPQSAALLAPSADQPPALCSTRANTRPVTHFLWRKRTQEGELVVFRERYEPQVEKRMRAFAQSLSEKDLRGFAALEAARLGHGGVEYVAQVLGCSKRTIERGAHELELLPNDPAVGRVRRPGGGQKKSRIRPEP